MNDADRIKRLEELVEDLTARVFALEHPHYCAECDRDFRNSEALYQHDKAAHLVRRTTR